MNQTEAKALQCDEDARHVGMEQLQNWGAMLRAQARVGPAGYKPSPIFKNITSRYPSEQSHVYETYRSDDAYLIMDLINWLVTDEAELSIMYLFYAEETTYSNTEQTLTKFNQGEAERGRKGIGESKLRSILTSKEIQIGTALIVATNDDSWKQITKLMAGK